MIRSSVIAEGVSVRRISVVGMGKLGACIAACLAHKGFDVVGVDVNRDTVDAVNAGEPPVQEPGLGDMIAANRQRLLATTDYHEAILQSDMSFLVVPTPSEDHGGFSLRYVSAAARSVGRALRDKNDYHLVVLSSTVLPGSTEYGIKPILEGESGKACGRDFGLCYSPEFIALGSVIRDFLNPDFVLIGESDERAGGLLAEFYKMVCDNDPTVARMSFVNAELTKLAINTFVTTKITFANMLAEICERLPGGDVDVVSAALGLDSRIGRRYLKGGLGYGGPCFPRDNVALSFMARQIGCTALLGECTDRLNREFVERLVAKVRERTEPDGTVVVLGLSYKPYSSVVEESQGLALAERLADNGVTVVVHDPIAEDNACRVLGHRVSYAETVADALRLANVVVVANPDPAFTSLRATDFPTRPVIVFDCWRVLRQALANTPGIEYIPLGVGNHDEELCERLAGMCGREAAKE